MPPTDRSRSPRKDQQRNRRVLLDAAREAFLDQGADVSLAEVARRASVGPTTLYRHFPAKDDLVDALLDDLADGARKVAGRARAESDPWDGFRLVFLEGCVLDRRDLALFDLLARVGPRAADRSRTITAEMIQPLVERAQQAGRLRTDVDAEDVAAFMRMADAAPAASHRRALEVLLDGLRTG